MLAAKILWGQILAVLDAGGVDHGVDEISFGVGEDVALAPLDLFARIVTPRSA